jgi:hypothetical protein
MSLLFLQFLDAAQMTVQSVHEIWRNSARRVTILALAKMASLHHMQPLTREVLCLSRKVGLEISVKYEYLDLQIAQA